ncbi:TPA: hypothetical protein DCX15_02815 [bacterium]|nr:hypothetical protein [bacterium]
MNLFINVRIALSNMRANKLRTILSLLGVIIGVGAVVIVGAIGMSGRDAVLDELKALGIKTIFVWRSWQEEDPDRFERSGQAITLDDLEAIKRDCQGITRIAPVNEGWATWVRYQGRHCRAHLVATTPAYKEIGNEDVTSGRFLHQGDIDGRRRVCVVGTEIIERLFKKGDSPIGKRIYYILGKGGKPGNYTIIGVLERKDTPLLAKVTGHGMEHNRRIIIPISVFQKEANSKEVWTVMAEAASSDVAKGAAEEIKQILKRRHKYKFTYDSETMQEHIEMTNAILGTVGWIAAISATISLLVGGIGIMNIMVSSVVERTREIGVRKSLGARNRDIFLQFLTEAVVISVIGGVVGCGLGIGVTILIQILSQKPHLLSTYFIILGLLVSVAVGILSGLYPALRAGRLDPVEALRYE